MRPPFRLVDEHLSNETVEALEQMIEQAKSGQIIGIAFVAVYKRRTYIADAAGEARRNPTFARGMVAALDDHLSNMVHRTIQS